ncbi:uncharacterized protein (DUF58 family) [Conyzicola nivalis]|uniref:Uncharacterized protein (DUF58 family) n=1 Tax=Conyzicola nivalis TaxID=1477021 RepID=A0ABV2QIK1_9MICO
MSLLRRVKTTLSIRAHRRVRGLLEGEYTSIFHGRSMEFDDLRPYVPGDEVRDIDWKATARLRTPMTKRFIASRKHTVLVIADTGRNMAALAEKGDTKSDLAILAAGTIGYIAIRHGDRVAMVAGDADHTVFVEPASTEAHLERMLQKIAANTSVAAGASDLTRQLEYAVRAFRRRMIVFVIADDRELGAPEQRLVRRLCVQHEVLWLRIGDADLMKPEWSSAGMHDVHDAAPIPAFVRGDPALRAEFAAAVAESSARAEDVFDGFAVSSQRVSAESDVVPGLFRLLEVHRHARR